MVGVRLNTINTFSLRGTQKQKQDFNLNFDQTKTRAL